jgi:hypothetical protein
VHVDRGASVHQCTTYSPSFGGMVPLGMFCARMMEHPFPSTLNWHEKPFAVDSRMVVPPLHVGSSGLRDSNPVDEVALEPALKAPTLHIATPTAMTTRIAQP